MVLTRGQKGKYNFAIFKVSVSISRLNNNVCKRVRRPLGWFLRYCVSTSLRCDADVTA